MTYTDSCKLATDCLPRAEHRSRLEALHGEMLAELKRVHADRDEAAVEVVRLIGLIDDMTIERDILRRDNCNHVAERERLRAALREAVPALGYCLDDSLELLTSRVREWGQYRIERQRKMAADYEKHWSAYEAARAALGE